MSEASQEYPLVSAIMLAGRTSIEDVLIAIDCFKAQTYPYKELIIVNNAKTQFDAAALNIKADREIFLADTPLQYFAGMARNYGIAAANGQILAQFDPDFWYAPNRIEAQVATLAENRAQVAILNSTLCYSFMSGRASYMTNERQAILNTMVCIRPPNIDYPNINKQEELGFLEKMIKAEMSVISLPAPNLACKLFLTNGERTYKPINNGLSKDDFKLVKKIAKCYRV